MISNIWGTFFESNMSKWYALSHFSDAMIANAQLRNMLWVRCAMLVQLLHVTSQLDRCWLYKVLTTEPSPEKRLYTVAWKFFRIFLTSLAWALISMICNLFTQLYPCHLSHLPRIFSETKTYPQAIWLEFQPMVLNLKWSFSLSRACQNARSTVY